MVLTFTQLKKPTIQLEAALMEMARQLCTSGEMTNALELFQALSIYKCQIQDRYRGDPDMTQVNLIKTEALTGLRIFRIGKGRDTAHVMQSHKQPFK
jgi:hypothetical protein